MKRFTDWYTRNAALIAAICGVVLLVVAFWLPHWAAIFAGVLTGATLWNVVYVRVQEARFNRQVRELQDETAQAFAALSSERKDSVVSLWVKQLDEDSYKVQVAQSVSLTPFQMRRIAILLVEAGRDLNLRADVQEQNGTDEHSGGANPSWN